MSAEGAIFKSCGALVVSARLAEVSKRVSWAATDSKTTLRKRFKGALVTIQTDEHGLGVWAVGSTPVRTVAGVLNLCVVNKKGEEALYDIQEAAKDFRSVRFSLCLTADPSTVFANGRPAVLRASAVGPDEVHFTHVDVVVANAGTAQVEIARAGDILKDATGGPLEPECSWIADGAHPVFPDDQKVPGDKLGSEGALTRLFIQGLLPTASVADGVCGWLISRLLASTAGDADAANAVREWLFASDEAVTRVWAATMDAAIALERTALGAPQFAAMLARSSESGEALANLMGGSMSAGAATGDALRRELSSVATAAPVVTDPAAPVPPPLLLTSPPPPTPPPAAAPAVRTQHTALNALAAGTAFAPPTTAVPAGGLSQQEADLIRAYLPASTDTDAAEVAFVATMGAPGLKPMRALLAHAAGGDAFVAAMQMQDAALGEDSEDALVATIEHMQALEELAVSGGAWSRPDRPAIGTTAAAGAWSRRELAKLARAAVAARSSAAVSNRVRPAVAAAAPDATMPAHTGSPPVFNRANMPYGTEGKVEKKEGAESLSAKVFAPLCSERALKRGLELMAAGALPDDIEEAKRLAAADALGASAGFFFVSNGACTSKMQGDSAPRIMHDARTPFHDAIRTHIRELVGDAKVASGAQKAHLDGILAALPTLTGLRTSMIVVTLGGKVSKSVDGARTGIGTSGPSSARSYAGTWGELTGTAAQDHFELAFKTLGQTIAWSVGAVLGLDAGPDGDYDLAALAADAFHVCGSEKAIELLDGELWGTLDLRMTRLRQESPLRRPNDPPVAPCRVDIRGLVAQIRATSLQDQQRRHMMDEYMAANLAARPKVAAPAAPKVATARKPATTVKPAAVAAVAPVAGVPVVADDTKKRTRSGEAKKKKATKKAEADATLAGTALAAIASGAPPVTQPHTIVVSTAAAAQAHAAAAERDDPPMIGPTASQLDAIVAEKGKIFKPEHCYAAMHRIMLKHGTKGAPWPCSAVYLFGACNRAADTCKSCMNVGTPVEPPAGTREAITRAADSSLVSQMVKDAG